MVFTCFELYFCVLSGQGGRPEISADLGNGMPGCASFDHPFCHAVW